MIARALGTCLIVPIISDGWGINVLGILSYAATTASCIGHGYVARYRIYKDIRYRVAEKRQIHSRKATEGMHHPSSVAAMIGYVPRHDYAGIRGYE